MQQQLRKKLYELERIRSKEHTEEGLSGFEQAVIKNYEESYQKAVDSKDKNMVDIFLSDINTILELYKESLNEQQV